MNLYKARVTFRKSRGNHLFAECYVCVRWMLVAILIAVTFVHHAEGANASFNLDFPYLLGGLSRDSEKSLLGSARSQNRNKVSHLNSRWIKPPDRTLACE